MKNEKFAENKNKKIKNSQNQSREMTTEMQVKARE